MVPDPHPLPNGRVIIFEGIDGVGKTTQLNLLQKTLEDAGWTVLSTRNLGGTPIGEALREVVLSPLERPPMTDFYLSLAIQEALLKTIDEARKAGKIILMDRGPLSLAAYQVYGTDIPEEIGWQQVVRGMERIQPDAVVLYDVAHPQTALQRKHGEKSDYFESKSHDYFQRVAEGYRTAAKRFPVVTTVDAEQPIEAIQEQTLAAISKVLAA